MSKKEFLIRILHKIQEHRLPAQALIIMLKEDYFSQHQEEEIYEIILSCVREVAQKQGEEFYSSFEIEIKKGLNLKNF